MDKILRIQKSLKHCCNIFSKILNEICPSIEPFLHLEISISSVTTSGNESVSAKSSLEWHKEQVIRNMEFSFQVLSDNQSEFEKIVCSGYQEDGRYIIFDMLIDRILDEIILLLDEDIQNTSIHINYPKDAIDLLNQSVMDFMYHIELPVLHGINYISSIPYEGIPCNGRIVFIKNIAQFDNMIKFDQGILFQKKNYRIIRKILQIAGQSKYVVYDINQAQIIGLIAEEHPFLSQKNTFILEYKGHMNWVLSYNGLNVIQYINGTYRIDNDTDILTNNTKNLILFYNNDTEKVDKALELLESATKQSHGTMVVISSNAEAEANRLSGNNRGIRINPINLAQNKEWIYSITSIDGALMLDEDLNCYSIGTLLDGPSFAGDISRGARFNSALSYVHWRETEMHENVLAIIVSEDKMVNTIYANGR